MEEVLEEHTKRYIKTNKVYIRSHTSSALIFQVRHQDSDLQDGNQIIQDRYLSFIQAK